MKTTPAIKRLLCRIDTSDPNECWLWPGGVAGRGYGVIGRGGASGGQTYVHRITYEAFVGPIPEGMVIDHLCRTLRCCNPAHLEAVTRGENVLRGEGLSAQAARRDHCVNGHPYTPSNTYTYRGARQCRTCRNAHRKGAA